MLIRRVPASIYSCTTPRFRMCACRATNRLRPSLPNHTFRFQRSNRCYGCGPVESNPYNPDATIECNPYDLILKDLVATAQELGEETGTPIVCGEQLRRLRCSAWPSAGCRKVFTDVEALGCQWDDDSFAALVDSCGLMNPPDTLALFQQFPKRGHLSVCAMVRMLCHPPTTVGSKSLPFNQLLAHRKDVQAAYLLFRELSKPLEESSKAGYQKNEHSRKAAEQSCLDDITCIHLINGCIRTKMPIKALIVTMHLWVVLLADIARCG